MCETKKNDSCSHLTDLIEYAFAIQERLQEINRHSFNNFQLRIGISNHFTFYFNNNFLFLRYQLRTIGMRCYRSTQTCV